LSGFGTPVTLEKSDSVFFFFLLLDCPILSFINVSSLAYHFSRTLRSIRHLQNHSLLSKFIPVYYIIKKYVCGRFSKNFKDSFILFLCHFSVLYKKKEDRLCIRSSFAIS